MYSPRVDILWGRDRWGPMGIGQKHQKPRLGFWAPHIFIARGSNPFIAHTHTHIHTHIYMYVCIYMCMYVMLWYGMVWYSMVCMYVYIQIYIYIYTYADFLLWMNIKLLATLAFTEIPGLAIPMVKAASTLGP